MMFGGLPVSSASAACETANKPIKAIAQQRANMDVSSVAIVDTKSNAGSDVIL
jgi:hypothetical protein